MSTPDQKKETLRKEALSYCADFISEWERASSIMDMMEDSVTDNIRSAEGGNKHVDLQYVLEQFSLNTYWMRRML